MLADSAETVQATCYINTQHQQGRSDGGYIGIHTSLNQFTLPIFMWLLVVFFLFDRRSSYSARWTLTCFGMTS